MASPSAPDAGVAGGLAAALRDRIRREGPVSFAEFMEAALYHPEEGYYATGRPLGCADFRTSPQVHPAFAGLLAEQMEEMYVRLGEPDGFRCVELGPGDGSLACGLARELERRIGARAAHWRLHLVESSPRLRTAQGEAVAGLPEEARRRIVWSQAGELPAGPADGVVVSNEFFDALPVHRVVVERGVLYELGVGLREPEDFREVVLRPAGKRLLDYQDRYAVPLAEGQRAEFCPAALDWVDRAAGMLDRGYLLTIDYGHPAGRLYVPERPDGTLTAYHRHRQADPLSAVGERDLTAHVNFTALARRAEEHGFQVAPLRTQSELLLALGVLDRLGRIDAGARSPAAALEERLALKELFVPGGMGETFRVQMAARGVSTALRGWTHPWRTAPPLDRPGPEG